MLNRLHVSHHPQETKNFRVNLASDRSDCRCESNVLDSVITSVSSNHTASPSVKVVTELQQTIEAMLRAAADHITDGIQREREGERERERERKEREIKERERKEREREKRERERETEKER